MLEFGYIILICITLTEDKPKSLDSVEEEKMSEHQDDNPTENPGPLTPATTLLALPEKSDNEQDVSAMEVE